MKYSKEFLQALFALQHDDAFPVMKKDTKAHHYKYFDINQMIESLKPLLKKHGFILMQPMNINIGDNQQNYISTQLIHMNTGEYITSEMVVEKQKDAQAFGSAITYFRRYTLQALLSMEAEDDDGQKSMPKTVRTFTRASEKQVKFLGSLAKQANDEDREHVKKNILENKPSYECSANAVSAAIKYFTGGK